LRWIGAEAKFLQMTCQKFLVCTVISCLFLGCGGGGTQFESTSFSTLPVDVEVRGNVRLTDADAGSIVVFGFVDLPPTGSVTTEEPTSIGSVRPDGRFELSAPPGNTLTVAFLADAANDGVVDSGDAIAVLLDPEAQLRNLTAGDSVDLLDVQVDFASGEALPTAVEVTRVAVPEVALTPIPDAPE
jgi:hypothetical protein